MKPITILFPAAAVCGMVIYIALNPSESLGALTSGMILAVMALGVFLTFRILDLADLSVDGTFTTGASVSAIFCMVSQPLLGTFLAFFAGAAAGVFTALLHTKLKIQPLLAGIITMTALYSINLKIMGAANRQLLSCPTLFSGAQKLLGNQYADFAPLIPAGAALIIVLLLLFWFLNTEAGFSLRAVGDNPGMAGSQGISITAAEIIGYALSNGFVALSGALFAQYQGFSDVSMGIGTVVIGLASVIIGEAFYSLFHFIFRKSAVGALKMLLLLISVGIGAVFYRFIYAIALDVNLNPNDMKLITALIVTVALAMPTVSEKLRKAAGRKRREAEPTNEGGTTDATGKPHQQNVF